LTSIGAHGRADAAPGVLIIGILFAGFIIARDNIPCLYFVLAHTSRLMRADWFIWIHHLSPFKYCFEALMINEFVGLGFKGPFGVLDGLLALCINVT
jgi:ABC-type multidrug transport system permease subunit